MKVLHVITGLGMGGAEMMLLKLLSASNKKSQHIVISLTGSGVIGERIIKAGFSVISLNMRGPVSLLSGLFKLSREIRKHSPDVVQTWMYHADLMGGCVAKLSGYSNIIWNIRNSNLDPEKTKSHTRLTVKISALFSSIIPKKIISNSKKSAEIHQVLGYKKDKFVIVPNGFELTHFSFSQAKRENVRSELGLSESEFLIGFVARFDPQKDHKGFVKSAAILKKKYKNVEFLLCGELLDNKNLLLKKWITKENLNNSFHLLGIRSDVNDVTASLDLATLSSSYGEAFPNVIGEAMASSIPCVVTDVGDSAWIVGDSGIVVPPNDPQALADAWESMLLMSREQRAELGQKARKRIEDNFSIKKISEQYENLYRDVIG